MNDLVEATEMLPSADAVNALGRNGHTLQQTRSSYATALMVQKPRQMAEVQRRFLDEARLAGEDFYYGWGSGQNAIEGPSVKLAMSLARCWGNCAIEAMPVQDMHDSWVFTAAFVDLETGFTLTRQFRQSKRWQVFGKHDAERKDDIRFQIGQSKAARNVVLNALPEWLIGKAMAEAKAGVREKIQDYVNKNGLVAAIDLAIKAFAKHGVKEELILTKCLVAKREAITIDHLVTLRGDLSAIESGQERPETLYPPEGSFSLPDQAGKSKTDQLAEKLKSRGQQTNADPSQPAPQQPQPTAPAPVPAPSAPAPLAEGELPPAPEGVDEDALKELLFNLQDGIEQSKSKKELTDGPGVTMSRNREMLEQSGHWDSVLKSFQKRFAELPEAAAAAKGKRNMF